MSVSSASLELSLSSSLEDQDADDDDDSEEKASVFLSCACHDKCTQCALSGSFFDEKLRGYLNHAHVLYCLIRLVPSISTCPHRDISA